MNKTSTDYQPFSFLKLKPYFIWLLIVIILDQITKYWIVQNYQLFDQTSITSFFNIVRAHNLGAAFSFLADQSGWQRWFFTILSSVITLVLIWMLYGSVKQNQKILSFAFASLIGGAIGNLIDRISHGYVVDFLDFYWNQSHFPAFNLADSAITLGIILLILSEVFAKKQKSD